MVSKNRNLFTGALTTVPPKAADAVALGQADPVDEPTARRPYIETRRNELARIANGEYITKTQHLVDPVRCRLWVHHNRRYELLNEERCRDLIEGIKAQGGQEFPAIVRKVKDDPNFDYEVICGARRHWAISWLRSQHYDFRFLVEIRDLSNEEAFRLSDIENRDREDISDYERAADYAQALAQFYGGSLKRMAERLEVNEPWLSRYLDMIDLPEQVVAAYPDVTHIKVNHARVLKPLLKVSKSRAAILKRAEELALSQREARANGLPTLEGQAVVARLKAATHVKLTSSGGVLATYKGKANGKPILEVSRKGRSGLLVRIIPESGASQEELVAAFQKALKDHLS